MFNLIPKKPGYVANTTEPIMEIVPEDNLQARVEINSSKIGFVQVGKKADISIDSFPSTDFGVVKGHIKTIGSDALNPDPQENRRDFVYPSRVNLISQKLLLDNDLKITFSTLYDLDEGDGHLYAFESEYEFNNGLSAIVGFNKINGDSSQGSMYRLNVMEDFSSFRTQITYNF